MYNGKQFGVKINIQWHTTCDNITDIILGKSFAKMARICFISKNELYKAYLAGGGGMWDFAIPIHATIPTARITHPNMSYFRSPLFFLEL